MPVRTSNIGSPPKISHHRASSIELELELLLALGAPSTSEDGGDNKRRKNGHSKDRINDESKEANNNDDPRAKRSARSKRISSNRDRSTKRSPRPSRSPKRTSPESSPNKTNSETDRNSSRKKSSGSAKVSRRIKYGAKEPETAEERDRDAKSQRSKNSKTSKVSKTSKASRMSRSSQRKQNRSKSAERIAAKLKSEKDKENGTSEKRDKNGEANARRKLLSKRISYRRKQEAPTTANPTPGDNQEITNKEVYNVRTIPIQKATPRRKAQRRRSWSFDDFSNTGFSSSEDEREIEVNLNDEGETKKVALNDVGIDERDDEDRPGAGRSNISDRKARPRRRPPSGKEIVRSSSTGGLGVKKDFNASFNASGPLEISSRRNGKRVSSGALSGIDVDNVLGDPSRLSRTPPRRSQSSELISISLNRPNKANESFSSFTSRVQIGGGERKAPPKRSQSNDFAEFLRKQGMALKSDRSGLITQKSDRGLLTRSSTSQKPERGSLTRGSTSQKSDRGLLTRSLSSQILDRGMMTRKSHSDHNGLESKRDDDGDDGDKSNPFEVTYQSHNASDGSGSADDWDPFASEDASPEHIAGIKNEPRRGKLRPTRSEGLLQMSSRDTISRLPIGACVVAAGSVSSNNSGSKNSRNSGSKNSSNNYSDNNRDKQRRADYKKSINAVAEKQRDKQYRADYKKSIAAAAMAGRQRISGSTPPRSLKRQSRTVQPSFEESMKLLELALQRA